MIRTPRGRQAELRVWLALAAACLLGCEGRPRTDLASGVPISAELKTAIEASRRSLKAEPGGEPAVRADLDRYFGLTEMFARSDQRRAAEDSLYALWSSDPAGMLWPEVAIFSRNLIEDPARFDAIFEREDFPDSASALGAFLREWKGTGPTLNGSGFRRAWQARSELTPWQDVWLSLRVSRIERREGRADEATRLAIRALPEARRLGGWRLELAAWLEAVRALRSEDHLDDALHAAVMAEDLAQAVARKTRNAYLVPLARLELAQVLGQRRATAAALRMYEACADSALAAHMRPLASEALNLAGILSKGTGEDSTALKFYRRSLTIALADHDSLYVPRHLANIGQRHLSMGHLDSCLIYFAKAGRWIEAYPAPANRARFPLIQASYYVQVGDFGTVDSLLAVAASLRPNFSSVAELAELHVQAIKYGMERGRPHQAYQSITALDSLRDRLGPSFGDRNELFDLELASAEFLARQGLFGRAVEALDRAEKALRKHPDPRREWELSRLRGHVAQYRGDFAAAETAYRVCLARSTDRQDPDGQAQSRLLLATALLEARHFDQMLELFPPTQELQFGGRFRTRLSGLLLAAVAESRRGRFEAALRDLGRARKICRPESPPDLLDRLELETGRALARLGRRSQARAAYGRVKQRLMMERLARSTDDPIFLDRDTRRELAEALLTMAVGDSGADLRGSRALDALRETEDLLPEWHGAPGQQVQRLLEPQVIYFVGSEASYRWTCVNGAISLRRLPGEQALLAAMAPVLADMQQPQRRPIPVELSTLAIALGGSVTGWQKQATLIIVPDGPLFAIPWAALPGGERGESDWIDHGPVLLAQAPAREPQPASRALARDSRLLALGVDGSRQAREASLSALHQAEREARDVFALWPANRATLRVGANANRDVFVAGQLSGLDVIHISTHALVYQGFADRTSLLLAGAAGVPLTAAEIGKLELQAELVFLSCCEAAESSRRGVGPAHAGLARSFLAAGAHCVVAPATRVEDGAARDFATRFYRHWLDGMSIEAALRMTQLDLRGSDARHVHPSTWAFYQAIAK